MLKFISFLHGLLSKLRGLTNRKQVFNEGQSDKIYPHF